MRIFISRTMRSVLSLFLSRKAFIRNIEKNNAGAVAMRVVLVAVSLSLIIVVLIGILDRYKKTTAIEHRKAVELSDFGIQSMMDNINQHLQMRQFSVGNISRTELENGSYSVAVNALYSDTSITLTLSSSGYYGSQEVVQKKTLQLVLCIENNDTLWCPR